MGPGMLLQFRGQRAVKWDFPALNSSLSYLSAFLKELTYSKPLAISLFKKNADNKITTY